DSPLVAAGGIPADRPDDDPVAIVAATAVPETARLPLPAEPRGPLRGEDAVTPGPGEAAGATDGDAEGPGAGRDATPRTPAHVAGIGATLFTDHLLTVEVVGLLLFVALIGAV